MQLCCKDKYRKFVCGIIFCCIFTLSITIKMKNNQYKTPYEEFQLTRYGNILADGKQDNELENRMQDQEEYWRKVDEHNEREIINLNN